MIKTKLKLYYKRHVKNSPLIIFIHGAACDHTIWLYQNRYFFNRNFSTILVDLPGHGNNRNKPLSSIKAMSNLVIDMIKKLNHKEIYLVGHSMGSLICLDLLVSEANLIKKAALIGISYPMQVNNKLLNKSKIFQDLAIDDMINWSLTDNIKLNGSNLIGLNLPNLINVVMNNSKKGLLYKDLLACDQFFLKENQIKNLNTPLTLISGEKDIMTPMKSLKNFHNIIPNSNLEIIKSVGHFHTLEEPVKINNIIENYFNEEKK